MFAWVDLLYAAAGGALVWHFKDTFVNFGHKLSAWWSKGKNDLATIEAQIKSLQAKVDAIKAAVK